MLHIIKSQRQVYIKKIKLNICFYLIASLTTSDDSRDIILLCIVCSAVSMWYSYISIDIDRYFTKYLDIDTPAIVATQNGAKTQCSIYQYCYLQ